MSKNYGSDIKITSEFKGQCDNFTDDFRNWIGLDPLHDPIKHGPPVNYWSFRKKPIRSGRS